MYLHYDLVRSFNLSGSKMDTVPFRRPKFRNRPGVELRTSSVERTSCFLLTIQSWFQVDQTLTIVDTDLDKIRVWVRTVRWTPFGLILPRTEGVLKCQIDSFFPSPYTVTITPECSVLHKSQVGDS